jgi:hypothetical protein
MEGDGDDGWMVVVIEDSGGARFKVQVYSPQLQ